MNGRTDFPRFETRCQLPDTPRGGAHPDPHGALGYPIYQTATFAHRGLDDPGDFDYTRMQNHTRERLEQAVRALEGGVDALAFTSGMAAVSAVMELFEPGDHLIVDDDLYGGSARLFNTINRKNGLVFTAVNCAEDDLAPHIGPRTRAVFLETPTNPMMRVTDLERLAAVTRRRGLTLIVDNTFLSPYLQNPLALGADIVIHSGTKYLGGHNDTICGLAVTASETLAARLRHILKTTGAGLSPFDSWLILRGLKTLAVRMDRAQENALVLARFLKERRQVTRVIYPGLPEHPGHAIMKKQARGFGAMLVFETANRDLARAVLERVRVIRFAESLGGTETLITYPVTQTHADVPPDQLARNGVTDRLLRLSVGIEHVADLQADLAAALEEGGRP